MTSQTPPSPNHVPSGVDTDFLADRWAGEDSILARYFRRRLLARVAVAVLSVAVATVLLLAVFGVLR